MPSLRSGAALLAIAAASAVFLPGCHFTVLPAEHAVSDSITDSATGRRVRPFPRNGPASGPDSTTRVDTVRILRVDTVRVLRVDTLVRVDTVRVRLPRPSSRPDTVVVVQVDTIRLRGATVVRVDTVLRVDTLRLPGQTVVRVDTVVVAGRRMLFVPPGHYPPDGQCRVWIHGRPPGQQAKAAPCDQLGSIPAGAFILFGGDAWDFDYDWIREAEANPGTVPPEIVAVTRRGSR